MLHFLIIENGGQKRQKNVAGEFVGPVFFL